MRYIGFALNESSDLVNAQDATKEENYFCPGCKAAMILRKGSIRRPHFAHKSNVNRPCGYESYLHQIAKIRIKKFFEETDQFNITLSTNYTCNEAACPLNMQRHCSWKGLKKFNLKELYDTCEIEKQIKWFIADLVLTNSTHTGREPIFIEIYVSHKCSGEKIASGIRIIEIKLQSEDDIDEIINSKTLAEHLRLKIMFYNFNACSSTSPPFNQQKYKYHFWIDEKRFFIQNDFGNSMVLNLPIVVYQNYLPRWRMHFFV